MAFVFFIALIGAVGVAVYYGRKKLWKHVGISSFAVLLAFIGIGVASPSPQKSPVAQPTVKASANKITKKTQNVTSPIPFNTVNKDDSTLAKGTTKVSQEGIDGVRTITYELTYTNGIQTNKQQISDVVTAPAVDKIVLNGTYVAPVTPPPTQTTAYRVGATCMDGSPSSATGSGACSHHGGVSCWQYSDGTCRAY